MATFTTKMASALLVALVLACSKEPYPLEGVLTGELPDQDLDVEAERADPGGEMHEPLVDFVQAPRRPCTPEELEEHRKSNTIGDRINEEGIVCLRDDPPRPVPHDPPAAPR